MAIRPLKDLDDPSGPNQICTTKWVRRFVRATLAKFNLHVEGGELEETGKGGLILRINPGTSSLNPFHVVGSGGTFRVNPGVYYTPDPEAPTSIETVVPVIGATPLDEDPEPLTLTTGFIALRMVFSAETGYHVGPWEVVATPTLSSTPLIRTVGEETGQDSEIDIMLAKIVGGTITARGLGFCPYVATSWNTPIWGGGNSYPGDTV